MAQEIVLKISVMNLLFVSSLILLGASGIAWCLMKKTASSPKRYFILMSACAILSTVFLFLSEAGYEPAYVSYIFIGLGHAPTPPSPKTISEPVIRPASQEENVRRLTDL